ncbi:tetratricopeptide repeat protein [Acetobacter aceti]|uniref:Tetratricopeptide repeat protein n=1 Tax=Acetobacter aceti TaxID=435 RepID=A0A6S6PLX7_ACEAC|nr:tetratricopeptide repeat protein [Acetobacter aceti]BCI68399.1 hypothetical protein AAJCM20276_30230 [Acetobacter aceti]
MSVNTELKEEEKSAVFDKAMSFMEDGDYEEACEVFAILVRNFPDDAGLWWQYYSALRRARLDDEADKCADDFVRLFPNDVGFILQWTRCTDARADWNESLRRREWMLKKHNPFSNIHFLPLVTECFLPLVETKNLPYLNKIVTQYWELFFVDGKCGAAVYYALEALGDYRRQIELCDRLLSTIEDGSSVVEGVDYINLRALAMSALNYHTLLNAQKERVSVLSLGQSCLPYTIANRWGLIDYAGDADITIFDLGAFSRNSAADAIRSDFSSYLQPENYYQGVDPSGAPQMFHKPSGVHFGHERGRTIIGDDQSAFHSLIKRKVDSFTRRFNKGHALLVFGMVGECDLPKFMEDMNPVLVEKSSRLLVLNLTRDPAAHPEQSNITYIHIPFPVDYNWNGINDYTSDRGLAFDSRVTSAILREIERTAKEN